MWLLTSIMQIRFACNHFVRRQCRHNILPDGRAHEISIEFLEGEISIQDTNIIRKSILTMTMRISQLIALKYEIVILCKFRVD